jgi:hypothetical protein
MIKSFREKNIFFWNVIELIFMRNKQINFNNLFVNIEISYDSLLLIILSIKLYAYLIINFISVLLYI